MYDCVLWFLPVLAIGKVLLGYHILQACVKEMRMAETRGLTYF